jgi:hypothetical protein
MTIRGRIDMTDILKHERSVAFSAQGILTGRIGYSDFPVREEVS